jgi:15-cis-phytoene synthase
MTSGLTDTVRDAYAHCEVVTRDQARNFYYGIRLLPSDKRSVLCAVYALARRIDDIGDGDLPTSEKLAQLKTLRAELGELGASYDPVLVAVGDAVRRYPVPLRAFEELIDGVEMDVTGRTYPTFDDLVGYCRCVAGTVGRLCLGVFGSRPDPNASRYADTLGIALQQTNILRDIREDLMAGRVYLPADDLDRFGVELALDERGALVDCEGRLSALITFSSERAQRWYDDGLRLVPLLDWRSAASCRAMAGIYRQLLVRIAAQPSTVFDRRLSLSGWQKAGVATRALTGLGV